MTAALLALPALAAIITAPTSPAPAATPVPVEIRDIAPPIDIFAYPLWMLALAAVLAGTLLGLMIWLLVRWMRNRPPPPLPSAAEIAQRELERLRQRVNELEPYAFSIAVSDVLRSFISHGKSHLPATHLTSPEFLAAISGSEMFSEDDRALLGRFLEKCDMIKFARVQATSADNVELVENALAFVQGGRS